MAKFVDNNGRDWIVSISYASIERVQSLVGVNLCEIVMGGQLASQFIWDSLMVSQVLWALCKPEADQAKITRDQFLDAIQGDPIDIAAIAVVEAMDTGFFSRHKRSIIRDLLVEMKKALENSTKTASPEETGNHSETGFSDSATTSQESSE